MQKFLGFFVFLMMNPLNMAMEPKKGNGSTQQSAPIAKKINLLSDQNSEDTNSTLSFRPADPVECDVSHPQPSGPSLSPAEQILQDTWEKNFPDFQPWTENKAWLERDKLWSKNPIYSYHLNISSHLKINKWSECVEDAHFMINKLSLLKAGASQLALELGYLLQDTVIKRNEMEIFLQAVFNVFRMMAAPPLANDPSKNSSMANHLEYLTEGREALDIIGTFFKHDASDDQKRRAKFWSALLPMIVPKRFSEFMPENQEDIEKLKYVYSQTVYFTLLNQKYGFFPRNSYPDEIRMVYDLVCQHDKIFYFLNSEIKNLQAKIFLLQKEDKNSQACISSLRDRLIKLLEDAQKNDPEETKIIYFKKNDQPSYKKNVIDVAEQACKIINQAAKLKKDQKDSKNIFVHRGLFYSKYDDKKKYSKLEEELLKLLEEKPLNQQEIGEVWGALTQSGIEDVKFIDQKIEFV